MLTSEVASTVAAIVEWAYKLPSYPNPRVSVNGSTRRDFRRLVRGAAPGLAAVLDRHMRGEYLHIKPPAWTPFERGALPELPEEVRNMDGLVGDDEVYLNSRYQVNVRFMGDRNGMGGPVHLSIKKRMKEPHVDWRDMQRIKNELCGPEREAVEVYPAESRLVDTSNQYHLWVMPEGERIPFGFGDRLVMDNDDLDKSSAASGASQREFK